MPERVRAGERCHLELAGRALLSGPVPPGPVAGDRSWLDGGSTGRPPGVPGPDIAMASTAATPTASVPPAVTVKGAPTGVFVVSGTRCRPGC